MNLENLSAFVATATWGSFAEAARHTATAKSTLVKRVGDLEHALSVRLVERAKRSVHLTQEGKALLGPAKVLLADAEDLEARMRSRSGHDGGTLRVTVPTLLGQVILPEIVARFAQKYPDARVDISFDDRYVDLVSEGFDCAIRVGNVRDPDLIRRKLSHSRLVLVARSGYTSAVSLDSPAQLDQVRTVSLLSEGTPEPWVLRGENEEMQFTPSSRLRLGNITALRRLIQMTDAVALLPHFLVAEELATGRLTRICPDWSGQVHDISAVFVSHRFLAPRVRHFIDMLVECFADDLVYRP